MTLYVRFCGRFLASCLLFTPLTLAQTGQGTMVGLVTDTTAAIVPATRVSLIHLETSFTYSAVTNEEGLYRIPYLNPGTYQVAFEAQGFKKVVRTGILVRSTETTRADVTLEVGAVAETVEVESQAALLETETSTVGHLVTGTTLNALPTPQMKIQTILFYMPGVTSQAGDGHVAGQRSQSLQCDHGWRFGHGTGSRRNCYGPLFGYRRGEHGRGEGPDHRAARRVRPLRRRHHERQLQERHQPAPRTRR